MSYLIRVIIAVFQLASCCLIEGRQFGSSNFMFFFVTISIKISVSIQNTQMALYLLGFAIRNLMSVDLKNMLYNCIYSFVNFSANSCA